MPVSFASRAPASASLRSPRQRVLALRGELGFAYRLPRGQLSFGMQAAPVQHKEQVTDRCEPVVVNLPVRRQLPQYSIADLLSAS
ncbi:MAG TPA: hypothetical protein VN969_03860 [Streptosporangiaceae bacterium]|nr:hypothetical protein [Streptosporangiaceae bacterium]